MVAAAHPRSRLGGPPDPDWTPGEGEDEGDRPFIDDPAAEQSQIPDPAATAPLVDDPEARAPLVTTTDYNVGGTQIPESAMAIDEATWQAWIADTAGQRWNGSGLEPFTDPQLYAAETLKQAVKAEAERRLDEGVEVPNLGRFKTDDRSLTRIQGILRSAEMMEAGGQSVAMTFMTEAGTQVSIASVQDVLDIFTPAWSHVGAVLATSATLQASIDGMTEAERQAFDPAAQPDWPIPSPSLP
jgi:hypothetical protein